MNEREAGAKAMLDGVDIRRPCWDDTVYWSTPEGFMWRGVEDGISAPAYLVAADDYKVVEPVPAVPECEGFEVWLVDWRDGLGSIEVIDKEGSCRYPLSSLHDLNNCPPDCFGFPYEQGVAWCLDATNWCCRKCGFLTSMLPVPCPHKGQETLRRATWARLVKGEPDA